MLGAQLLRSHRLARHSWCQALQSVKLRDNRAGPKTPNKQIWTSQTCLYLVWSCWQSRFRRLQPLTELVHPFTTPETKLKPVRLKVNRHKKRPPNWVALFYYLVEPSGIEPLTSTLPVLRSPS